MQLVDVMVIKKKQSAQMGFRKSSNKEELHIAIVTLFCKMSNILLPLIPSQIVYFLTSFYFQLFYNSWNQDLSCAYREQRSELLFSKVAIHLAFKETPEGAICAHSSWQFLPKRSITPPLHRPSLSRSQEGSPTSPPTPRYWFGKPTNQSFATWLTQQPYLSFQQMWSLCRPDFPQKCTI